MIFTLTRVSTHLLFGVVNLLQRALFIRVGAVHAREVLLLVLSLLAAGRSHFLIFSHFTQILAESTLDCES